MSEQDPNRTRRQGGAGGAEAGKRSREEMGAGGSGQLCTGHLRGVMGEGSRMTDKHCSCTNRARQDRSQGAAEASQLPPDQAL
eukprot:2303116-Alexandrium_andersonii.AAC.1